MGYIKVIISTIFFLIQSSLVAMTISHEDGGGGAMGHFIIVNYSSDEPINEFSFTVTGAFPGYISNWNNSTGDGCCGAINDYGFTVNFNGNTITGVSNGSPIPSGSGELLRFETIQWYGGQMPDITLELDGQPSPNYLSISDGGGGAMGHFIIVNYLSDEPINEFSFSVTGALPGYISNWNNSTGDGCCGAINDYGFTVNFDGNTITGVSNGNPIPSGYGELLRFETTQWYGGQMPEIDIDINYFTSNSSDDLIFCFEDNCNTSSSDNQCYCSNGTSSTGADCSSNGSNSCESCDTGYYLSGDDCYENTCYCSNGYATYGTDCPSDGDTSCSACYDGYALIDGDCISYSYYCYFNSYAGYAPYCSEACDYDNYDSSSCSTACAVGDTDSCEINCENNYDDCDKACDNDSDYCDEACDDDSSYCDESCDAGNDEDCDYACDYDSSYCDEACDYDEDDSYACSTACSNGDQDSCIASCENDYNSSSCSTACSNGDQDSCITNCDYNSDSSSCSAACSNGHQSSCENNCDYNSYDCGAACDGNSSYCDDACDYDSSYCGKACDEYSDYCDEACDYDSSYCDESCDYGNYDDCATACSFDGDQESCITDCDEYQNESSCSTACSNGDSDSCETNCDYNSSNCDESCAAGNTFHCPTVDCVGSWSDTGSCSAACGEGTQLQTYTVSVVSSNGGSDCSNADGDTQTVSCTGSGVVDGCGICGGNSFADYDSDGIPDDCDSDADGDGFQACDDTVNYVYNSWRGVNPAGYVETHGALEMIGSKTMMGWINLDEIHENTDLYTDTNPYIAVYRRQHPNLYKSAIIYSQDNGWGLFFTGHGNIYSNVVETSFDDWVHIASTYEDYDFRLYRNGELILTITDYPTVDFGAVGSPNGGVGTKFTLGHMDFHGGAGLAKFDDVSLWHNVLSQSDIQDIMNNGIDFNNYAMSDGFPHNELPDSIELIAYYSFDELVDNPSGNNACSACRIPPVPCNDLDNDQDGLCDNNMVFRQSGQWLESVSPYAQNCDSDDNNQFVCGDTDGDSCDDCSSGSYDNLNDGTDYDGDGLCDQGDSDDDNDGVLDVYDSNSFDPNLCSDNDGDSCDDCSSGSYDNLNDGTDYDGDGLCDLGDSDDDNDGVLDVDDCAATDELISNSDCLGVCGGTAVEDCANVCDGSAAVDDCGVCSGGNTGLTANADKDECGECNGPGLGANQYLTGGVCYDVTAPSDGYYISSPATSNSDNIFSECSECGQGFSVSAECTDVSDTVCDAILCAADEYVSSNTCVPCDSGYVNTSGDDASSLDTVCDLVVDCVGSWSDWSDCSAGETCVSGTQDRVFVVTTPAEFGGTDCIAADNAQETQSCDGTGQLDMCNVCDTDPTNDCVQDCAGTWGGTVVLGDLNNDGGLNIADIVHLVHSILGADIDDSCGDVNGDGFINVSDVTSLVNIVLDFRLFAIDGALESKLILSENSLRLESDGFVQGVQLTLSHGSRFEINLKDAFISEYVTNYNKTTLMIVTDGSHSITDIATFEGDVTVESVHVVSQSGDVNVEQVIELSSIKAKVVGPNPFNPSTQISVAIPEAGLVSVNVYNVLGQKVATLVDGYMDANTAGHIVSFNASHLASGIYLVQAVSNGDISTQKVMLLK